MEERAFGALGNLSGSLSGPFGSSRVPSGGARNSFWSFWVSLGALFWLQFETQGFWQNLGSQTWVQNSPLGVLLVSSRHPLGALWKRPVAFWSFWVSLEGVVLAAV